jgi:hypothetical protein
LSIAPVCGPSVQLNYWPDCRPHMAWQSRQALVSPTDWQTIELTEASGSGDFQTGPQLPLVDRAARREWAYRWCEHCSHYRNPVARRRGRHHPRPRQQHRHQWGTPGTTFNSNEVVARTEGPFHLDVERPLGIVRPPWPPTAQVARRTVSAGHLLSNCESRTGITARALSPHTFGRLQVLHYQSRARPCTRRP